MLYWSNYVRDRKFRSTREIETKDSKLRRESVRGWEEKFETKFWARGVIGRAERFELIRGDNFLCRIILWRADWNST